MFYLIITLHHIIILMYNINLISYCIKFYILSADIHIYISLNNKHKTLEIKHKLEIESINYKKINNN